MSGPARRTMPTPVIPPVVVEPWSVAPPAEFIACGAPRIAVEDVPRCPLCAGDRFEAAAVGFDYELRTCRNAWRLVRCAAEACGHVWLNPRPATSRLSTIYPPHYYAYRYQDAVPGVALKIKNALDARKFAGILKDAGVRSPRGFADVGCGDGRYLRLARHAGTPDERNFGLELDQGVVERLRCEGFVGVHDRVETCTRIPDGALDLCTMFHVIEHVDDPVRVVSRIAAWLAPGGVLALETPNLDSLDARSFARTFWGGYHIPRHWNLFTPRTLERLMRAAGLEVIRTRYQTGHSFWMYSVHHSARYVRGARAAGLGGVCRVASRAFDPFGGVVALPALAAFTGFDLLRSAAGCRTSSMLMLARKPR